MKDILKFLALSGAFMIAASSEKFWWDFWLKILGMKKKSVKYPKKKVYDNFYLLLKNGFIIIERRGKQIYISLSEKGKAKAGWLQIDDLEIKKPKKWDGKWRVLIFDISQMKKIHREALRGKLKELGFHLLQKSVWIHPFDCETEIELLREFFGLSSEEMRLIVAENIGPEEKFKKLFKVL
ncbi:MAG: hypothetical protein ACPLW9_01070 [Minisyncoccales bacterium]